MDAKSLLASKVGWGLTILRVAAGAIFIGHGLPKFGWAWWRPDRDLAGTAAYLESIGLPLPYLSALLVGTAEIFGGAMLIAGLFSRIAGSALAFAMLVAIFAVHFENGFLGQGSYQWALLLFAAAMAIVFEGPGRLSLDSRLFTRPGGS